MKYPHIEQHDERDCGAACLSMIAEFFGAKLTIAKCRELICVDHMGANIYGLVTGAKEIGLDADALEGSYEELLQGISDGEIRFPVIARIVNEANFEHYIVIYARKKTGFVIGDPARGRILTMPEEIFKSQWQGQIITFAPNASFEKHNDRKGSFGKFFRYITKQKKLLAVVFVISVIITAINLSGSLVFQYVIGAVEETAVTEEMAAQAHEHEHEHEHEHADIEEDSTPFMSALESFEHRFEAIFRNLNSVCIAVICLYLLRTVLRILRGYLLSKTAKLVDIPLTMNYYEHLLDLPAGFYGNRKTGEYMSRFNDTGKIRDAISTTTMTLMIDTIMAVGCGVLLFCISKTLLLITLIVVAIYAAVMFAFRRPIRNINHEIMEDEAQVTSYLKESIDGIETVRANGCEAAAKAKTNRLYDRFVSRNVRGSVIYTVQESLVSAVSAIGVVCLLWVGASLCVKNIISLTDLLIFYYMISYFLDPIQNLINLQPELQTAIVAAERLNDILDVEAENNDMPEAKELRGDIRVQNVDFRYGNREQVLNGLSMTFANGRKTAVIGESGCGKTTLAKLLLSFYQPEAGSITVGDKDIRTFSPRSVRERVAYVAQDVFLFSDTVYENLRMGNPAITDEQIEAVCKMCKMDAFIQSLPLGFQTVLDENGSNLSGGQKQRLAIARALLRNPDILILDEATSNLDTVTEQGIRETIDKLSENLTCIIIAHRLNTIRNCDYIYVMENGSVAEAGTHDSLMQKGGFYKHYLDAQA